MKLQLKKDDALRGILDIAYHFDNGMSVTSVSGYQHSETINNRSNNSGVGPYDDPTDILSYNIGFLSRGSFTLVSQEFNLLSSEDQCLRWVTGVFYQHVKSIIPPYPVNGFNLTLLILGAIYPFVYSAWENLEDDLSAFGNVRFDLTDTLEFEVGVRQSHYERVQNIQFTASDDFGFTLPPTTATEPPSHEKVTENSTDYRIGLNWSVRPEHFLYAFVARGHTTGGINIAGPPHLHYKEGKLHDFEAGWKGTLLDGRVQTRIGDTTNTPRADYSYIGKQKDGLYDIPPLRLKERKLLNLAIRFEHGPWYGQVYCSNCTDLTYVGGIQELGQLDYMAPPRMYGVKVGRRFE